MRIQQLIEAIELNEAREAPLYHFTSEAAFFKILSTDTLVAGGAKLRGGGMDPDARIYFTRDYGRQFLPSKILAGSWGFRVDQDLLRHRYGRKLVAGGQGKHSPWDEKKRQDWLADPKNADEIARVKSGASGSTSRQDGADTKDIVKGTIGQSQRWESEEHLNVGSIPNFHEYITGLVYAGGSKADPHRTVIGSKKVDFKSRGTNVSTGLDELAQLLMGHFVGQAGWAQRDALIEYMTKFDIPFVYRRQDFPAKVVKDRMIAIWRERKAEKTRRASEDSKFYTVIRNPEGGGVGVSAPDMLIAADRALQDMPHKFPNGVYGVKEVSTGETIWFAQPKTKVGEKPQVKQPAQA